MKTIVTRHAVLCSMYMCIVESLLSELVSECLCTYIPYTPAGHTLVQSTDEDSVEEDVDDGPRT